MPEKPLQELWVALAGPMVNAVIAVILLVVLLFTQNFNLVDLLTAQNLNFVQRIFAVNAMLALFNLIPAFPMDGGRAVRALLAMRLDYTRATHIAALLGQGVAFLLGFIGLFFNPMLIFIALFVWIGAAQESSMTQMKSSLSGIPIQRAMLTEFHTLSPSDTLGKAVQLILSGSQHDFPVVGGDGKVIGILSRQDVFHSLSTYGENLVVSHAMHKDFRVIDSDQMLEAVSQQVQDTGEGIIPVIHNNALVGLITMENIGEFLMIQNALSKRKNAVSLSGGEQLN